MLSDYRLRFVVLQLQVCWNLPRPRDNVVRVQCPLKLAWALTVHRSQGMTLDYVECHLAGTFSYGQAYVALSRASSLQGLRVVGLSRDVVKAHPDVQSFYNTFEDSNRMHARYLPHH